MDKDPVYPRGSSGERMPARGFQRSSRVEGRALGARVKRMDAYASLHRKNL
jgi:hypothetical protein